MRPDHVVRARFAGVTPLAGGSGAGLALRFELQHARLGVSEIEDYADLGPELTPLAVEGVGKLLRLLRAARIAPPPAPFALAGDAAAAARWASRAVGAAVRLSLRRRSSVRFTAWTESGVVEVDDVAEVREEGGAIWVIRRDVRLPLRLERDRVVRRVTETLRSFEVLAIERDPALGSAGAAGRTPVARPRPPRLEPAEDAPMAEPVVIPDLADARDYAGRELGATEWFEIDQARVAAFAAATGEDHWLHLDPERACRESPWKTTVIPGFLLLSLVPDLLPRLLVLRGWATAVNAGVDDCSFAHPAPVGSRIRMAARISRVRKVPGGGLRVTFAIAFEVEGAREPACKARVHYAYFA